MPVPPNNATLELVQRHILLCVGAAGMYFGIHKIEKRVQFVMDLTKACHQARRNKTTCGRWELCDWRVPIDDL